MRKWLQEDWEFTLTVTSGRAEQCRIGMEAGDSFTCRYECPGGFCPKTMGILYTYCEVVRCGGDFRLRGSKEPYELDFCCADGVLGLHLSARHVG